MTYPITYVSRHTVVKKNWFHLSSLFKCNVRCRSEESKMLKTDDNEIGTRSLDVLTSDDKDHVSLKSSTCFPKDTTVLFLSNLYPEPNASAAGVRTSYLIRQLIASEGISSVHYASSSRRPTTNEKTGGLKSEKQLSTYHLSIDVDTYSNCEVRNLEDLGVCFHYLPPNRSDLARELLLYTLPQTHNLLVIFDRFYSEEMYSFHVHQHCRDNAVLILDMQDMHSLRWLRQDYVEKQKHQKNDFNNLKDDLSGLPVHIRPKSNDNRILRELSSIHRSDLALVCSKAELDLLSSPLYSIELDKLCLAPLFGDLNSKDKYSSLNFHTRHHYVFVGGFRHDPNVDAVVQLHRLWPQIRNELSSRGFTGVCLHIYGSYCSDHLKNKFHDPRNGLYMHGSYSGSVDEILRKRRVMLAPLRYGAGIKGKIVDAWNNGLPVVTTLIGSEGLDFISKGNNKHEAATNWGGCVVQNDNDFVQAAVDLYIDSAKHEKAVLAMPELLSQLCGDRIWESVSRSLVRILRDKITRRETDYTRAILWHQANRSTEYFSKYIECKEDRKHSNSKKDS